MNIYWKSLNINNHNSSSSSRSSKKTAKTIFPQCKEEGIWCKHKHSSFSTITNEWKSHSSVVEKHALSASLIRDESIDKRVIVMQKIYKQAEKFIKKN